MKRTRSHQVSFRLSDKEYALLQRKLAASGKSLTEFFIETISKGKVIVILTVGFGFLEVCLSESKSWRLSHPLL